MRLIDADELLRNLEEYFNKKEQDAKFTGNRGSEVSWNDAIYYIKTAPSAQPEYRLDEWCTDCKEYDTEKHCCPRFNQVIRTTLNEMKSERKKGKWIYKNDLKQYFCSECGFPSLTYDDVYIYSMDLPNFCEDCGADMRGEQDET